MPHFYGSSDPSNPAHPPRRQGPWGSGGGGGGGQGPWGGGGGGNSSGQPPDFEDLARQAQEKLKAILPGGLLGGGRGLVIVAIAIVGIWLISGFYRVLPDEQGVVLRFGKFTEQTAPGLNYHLPWPIETAITPKVTVVNRVDIGLRVGGDNTSGGRVVAARDVPEESLMLTGDENIVDVDFSVFWVIKSAGDYLFNIQDPDGTVKTVAESTMREVVGKSDIQPILTEERQSTEEAVHALMQQTMDEYGAGIAITQVKMQKVDPPGAVIDAFRDVQAARADQERARNEANAYRNKVVPEARGEAARIRNESQAYREQAIAEAEGQGQRFLAIYQEYKGARGVTRQRMFLETMERVLSGSEKVIIDSGAEGTQGVVPYLPLNELRKKSPATGDDQ